MTMTIELKGAYRDWTILKARQWMREHHQLRHTVRTLADEAAKAFNVYEMYRHLQPGDHWVFDVALEVIVEHQEEVRRAREYFAALAA